MVYYNDGRGFSQRRALFFSATGIVFQRKKRKRITLPFITYYLPLEDVLLFVSTRSEFSGDAMTKSGK